MRLPEPPQEYSAEYLRQLIRHLSTLLQNEDDDMTTPTGNTHTLTDAAQTIYSAGSPAIITGWLLPTTADIEVNITLGDATLWSGTHKAGSEAVRVIPEGMAISAGESISASGDGARLRISTLQSSAGA